MFYKKPLMHSPYSPFCCTFCPVNSGLPLASFLLEQSNKALGGLHEETSGGSRGIQAELFRLIALHLSYLGRTRDERVLTENAEKDTFYVLQVCSSD
jgi:hypothetical protein